LPNWWQLLETRKEPYEKGKVKNLRTFLEHSRL